MAARKTGSYPVRQAKNLEIRLLSRKSGSYPVRQAPIWKTGSYMEDSLDLDHGSFRHWRQEAELNHAADLESSGPGPFTSVQASRGTPQIGRFTETVGNFLMNEQ